MTNQVVIQMAKELKQASAKNDAPIWLKLAKLALKTSSSKRVLNLTKINDVTKEDQLRVNEPHFKKCFDILQHIKDELNFPVNRAGLIFRQGEELDLDAIMRTIEEGG